MTALPQFIVSVLVMPMLAASAAKADGVAMSRLLKSADIVEIGQLINHFGHALDSGRLNEVAGMFSATGGMGRYYEDPNSSTLHLTGASSMPGVPGCLIFGRPNIVASMAALGYGGDRARPHAKGWAGSGQWPGTMVTRHQYVVPVIDVTEDTATVRTEITGSQGLYESNLVRTKDGWRFQFLHIIYEAPQSNERPCTIVDPKFPLPKPGSPGADPDFVNPRF